MRNLVCMCIERIIIGMFGSVDNLNRIMSTIMICRVAMMMSVVVFSSIVRIPICCKVVVGVRVVQLPAPSGAVAIGGDRCGCYAWCDYRTNASLTL